MPNKSGTDLQYDECNVYHKFTIQCKLHVTNWLEKQLKKARRFLDIFSQTRTMFLSNQQYQLERGPNKPQFPYPYGKHPFPHRSRRNLHFPH